MMSRLAGATLFTFTALAMSCGRSSSSNDGGRDAGNNGSDAASEVALDVRLDVAVDVPGGSPCTGGQILVYSSPGCGASTPTPFCAGPTFDACAITACGCAGAEIGGCGVYSEPFAHLGPCADAGSPADAADAADVRPTSPPATTAPRE
jgi:hypothetical protein